MGTGSCIRAHGPEAGGGPPIECFCRPFHLVQSNFWGGGKRARILALPRSGRPKTKGSLWNRISNGLLETPYSRFVPSATWNGGNTNQRIRGENGRCLELLWEGAGAVGSKQGGPPGTDSRPLKWALGARMEGGILCRSLLKCTALCSGASTAGFTERSILWAKVGSAREDPGTTGFAMVSSRQSTVSQTTLTPPSFSSRGRCCFFDKMPRWEETLLGDRYQLRTVTGEINQHYPRTQSPARCSYRQHHLVKSGNNSRTHNPH